jgi:hypothetical protein
MPLSLTDGIALSGLHRAVFLATQKECHNCVITDMQNNVIKLRHYCYGPLFFGSKYVKWLYEEEVVLFRMYCSLWNAFASIQFGKGLLFRV